MFNLFDLVATLSLNTKPYEEGMSNASNRTEGLKKKFSALKIAGVAMFTAVSAVAIKFGKDSIQAGMEFDQSMSQVSATMGDSAQEMMDYNGKTMTQIEALTDFAKQMGATTAFSATQASEGLNYMALAGYNAETSIAMLPSVLNLASAGAMELGTASDMLTDTQSALGLSIDETTELVDKMAKTASKSNTSVEQLGTAMLQIGGTAKGLKGGTTELATALGILADNGVKGAEGGTALRNVLLGIQGKKFGKTFGELGISAYDADGNLRPLKDTLADMNEAMEGMTDEQKTKLITSTFNKQDLKNVNALLATTTERWDELSGAIDDSAGSAEAMAKTQLDNLAGDVTLFKSALEGAQIALSDRLTPSLRNLVKFGTEGLGKLQEAFEKPEQGIKNLEKWIKTNAQEAFFAFMESIKQLPDRIGEFLNSGWLEDIGSFILIKMRKFAEDMPTVIAQILERISAYLSDHADDLVAKGWELLKSIVKGILKALPILAEALGHILQAVVNGLGAILKPAWDKAVEIAKAIGDAIKSKAQELKQKVKDFASKIPEAIKSALLGIYNIGANIVTGLWNGISDKAQWLKSMISGWIGNVKDFLKNLFGISSPSKWARDVIGSNIVKGLILGIENGDDKVQSAFDDLMPDYDGNYMATASRPLGAGVSIVNYITVDGAENPEDFTDRFVRRLRMDMRTV